MGKIVVMAVMVFLAGLVGLAPGGEPDPSLVAWWKLDGDLMDASANGHDGGTFTGDAHFEAGLFDQALALDGTGDYVTIDGYTGVAGTQSRTVTAWIKTTGLGSIAAWGENVAGQKWNFRVQNNNGKAGAIRVEVNGGYQVGSTDVRDDEWHHAAAVLVDDGSPNATEIQLYVDGTREASSASQDEPINTAATHSFWIGFDHSSRAFPGLIDEVRLYDRALTASELGVLALRPRAYGPSPADGTIGVTSPLLTWKPRQTALFHDVYVGTSPDLGPDDLVAPRSRNTLYWHAPGLEPGTTYYWRVDEIEADGTTYPGDVWSFFVVPLEAWDPQPQDGTRFMDPNVTLRWAAGMAVISHDVYFGTDQAAVAEGVGDTFKGNRFTTTYVTGDLEIDTTYYWRIDGVDADGNKTTGFVWSFTTLPPIPITDENLVAWWNMDEGAGRRVVDWSGHGHHGDLVGAPQWMAGVDGSALQFGGVAGERVEMRGYDGVLGTQDRTVTAWIKTAALGDIVSWGQSVEGQKWIFRVQDNNGNPGTIRVEVATGRIVAYTDVRDDEWHHVAAVLESAEMPTVSDISLYLDGLREPISDSVIVDINTVGGRDVWVGDGHHNRPFPGLIDDVRIYDKALSQEELELAMRIDPLRAWRPSPADGVLADIRTASPLTWLKGDGASKHDVYFGTDAAAVAAADAADATGVYRARVGPASYALHEELEWGQKYFWRVDELNVDGSLTKGRVWSFTVADYLIVDDFESYTNDSPNRVFQTWIDGLGFSPDEHFPDGSLGNGTGAAVGYDIWSVDSPHYNGMIMERANVFSGHQAAPMDYNNAISPYYSEIERTWTTPQNWTFRDVNALVVHFRGEPVDFLQVAPDTILMSAAGTDIWGTADEFRFVFKRLNGDGSIIASVESIVNTNVWAKAGVMIRENLDPGSRCAAVYATPGSGVAFQRRLATGSDAIGTSEAGVVAPRWVKLTRTGNELVAQHSADGVTWGNVTNATNPTSDTVVMGGTIYIGLALTSHSADNATTARFSGIQTTGGVSGQWQVADIGVAHPGNSPETLYVAVEDSGGRMAVIPHPDPAATTLDTWQRWTIDLAELTAKGVNLRSIKKMMVGVGDRDNPRLDGAGRIFIDDIRVTRPVPVEPNDVAIVP